MKIGPKYKIARRLGNTVFEKTQSEKFILKEQAKKTRRAKRPRSNFGIQLIEKQKVRFTYGLSEKQFSNYVRTIISKKAENADSNLFNLLERRLDNVVYKSGFVKTRQAARQAVSHGHIRVNGKRMNIPSYSVKEGDVISIKDKSKEKGMWQDLNDKDRQIPNWISVNASNKEINIKGGPNYVQKESDFNLSAVLQFYNR